MSRCDILIATVSKRSPVLGYNHNFKHRGLIFHVQTEDSGVDNPHLFTHLFHGGVIISSRKINYDAESEEDVVKSLMQSQHKAVLKDLKIGTFDDKIDAYLGDKEDLLPRKADSVANAKPADTQPAAEAPPQTPADRAATEPSPVSPTAETEPKAPVPTPGPPPIPGVSVPDAAHSAAISLDGPSAVPQRVADAPATVPVHVPPDAVIELERPLSTSTKHRHERDPIPTPLAFPAVTTDSLGDPIVTFNSGAGSSPVETPPPETGERSGTYSIQRPTAGRRRRPTTQTRAALGSPRSPERTGEAPSGKAANAQPGKRRSSVVVSRPAVIIGAPARSVGRDGSKRDSRRSNRRTPPARKSRSKDLFGNDTISEKSLDEVIMAYLSEDNSEE